MADKFAYGLTLTDIIEARSRIKNVVRKTPLEKSIPLSNEYGGDFWFKLENLQITGSFKLRGAANKILSLSQEELDAGIVCASAGNHEDCRHKYYCCTGEFTHTEHLADKKESQQSGKNRSQSAQKTVTFGFCILLDHRLYCQTECRADKSEGHDCVGNTSFYRILFVENPTMC